MAAAATEVALDTMGRAISNAPAVVSHLKELTAPLVAIDPDYRPTDVDGLRRQGVETVVMAECAHVLMLEDPATFNRLLRETVEGFIAAR